MLAVAVLILSTQGLSLQLAALPHLRKSSAAVRTTTPAASKTYEPAKRVTQLLPYQAFGLIVPLWIMLSTQNAEAITATPRPGADETQISLSSRLETSAQWRVGEKDKAEAANAQMYKERRAADTSRAREREARRALVESRRLEAGGEASEVAAARMLEKATVEQARAAAMQEAAVAAQERATAAKARTTAARSMSAKGLVATSVAEKVMSPDELAAAAALKAEQVAMDAEVTTTLVHALPPCSPERQGCNPVYPRLQPCVSEAATLCARWRLRSRVRRRWCLVRARSGRSGLRASTRRTERRSRLCAP